VWGTTVLTSYLVLVWCPLSPLNYDRRF
jgi:hypothetical protein